MHRLIATLIAGLIFAPAFTAQEPVASLGTDGSMTSVQITTVPGTTMVRSTADSVEGLRVLTPPVGPVVAVLWTERDAAGTVTPWFALSLDGGATFPQVTSTSYTLQIRYRPFDPVVQPEPWIPAPLRAPANGRLWIVQYRTQGVEPWRDVIRALGGVDHLFLADHANVWEMDAGLAALVSKLSFVRWVGPFHPAYKLDPVLLDQQLRGVGDPPVKRTNIVTTARGIAQKERVAERIQRLGGSVVMMSHYTHIMRADLSPAMVAEVARLDEVQWLDPWGPCENDMDVVRTFHGSGYVENLGFDGTGVRGEVLDGGTEVTHPEFSPAPINHGTVDPGDHGTCTYSIVFANGATGQARGILNNGTGIAGDYFPDLYNGVTDRYVYTQELVNPAGAYRAVFQSNSWGHPTTTIYNSYSTEMDDILFDLNLTICQSQSNTSNQNSRPESWAKNVLSVGGIWHKDTATKADDLWNGPGPTAQCAGISLGGDGSIGPAEDGRIKPDIASFYDCIYAADQVGASGYVAGDYLANFGGTSGATPIVAGHVGLFYQMWHLGVFHNLTSTSVFNSRPQNTTAKAFMIATATQWTFSGTGHDLTRTHQGWGHPDVRTMYDSSDNLFFVDETDVLTNLQTKTYAVSVPSNQPELKIVLCYRDPGGTTAATTHRINNLNLTVVSPAGTTFRGNNGLSANNYSTSGGTANTKDTVECVFIQNPAAGSWRISVTAAELNQDNHVETAAVDADYALVCVGAGGCPVFTLIHRTQGTGNAQLGLCNIPVGVSEGYTVFSFNTAGPVGGGPIFGMWIDGISLISFTSAAGAGNPFHWTWPVLPPLYPASDIITPPGTIPPGVVLDTLGVGISAGFANVYATQVVRLVF